MPRACLGTGTIAHRRAVFRTGRRTARKQRAGPRLSGRKRHLAQVPMAFGRRTNPEVPSMCRRRPKSAWGLKALYATSGIRQPIVTRMGGNPAQTGFRELRLQASREGRIQP